MPTRNVNLTDHYDQFVEQQIEAGQYQNASEVLRAGLRLLEQQAQSETQKLALMKQLASDGFASLDQGQGLMLADEHAIRHTIGQIGERAAKVANRRRAN